MIYSSSWRAPSNIALVKYWGKHGLQLPRNPSLSFTLSACLTKMRLKVETGSLKPGIVVRYDRRHTPAFEPKIKTFLDHVLTRFPWLEGASVLINSVNTFPQGTGIASSASAMSALALCLMDIDDQIARRGWIHNEQWWHTVSEIARLGSGSACRSLFPAASLWGRTDGVEESSDTYAIPWKEMVAPVFHDYCDTILVVSSSEKAVSSTAGHALMNSLAYAKNRYAEARRNVQRLITALRDGDLDTFISVCETEALQLHALMMSGASPYILMEPGTVSIIKEVWRFRKETGTPVCFTLDAGPNVHILYPAADQAKVMEWIKSELTQHCTDGYYIEDRVGDGPVCFG